MIFVTGLLGTCHKRRVVIGLMSCGKSYYISRQVGVLWTCGSQSVTRRNSCLMFAGGIEAGRDTTPDQSIHHPCVKDFWLAVSRSVLVVSNESLSLSCVSIWMINFKCTWLISIDMHVYHCINIQFSCQKGTTIQPTNLALLLISHAHRSRWIHLLLSCLRPMLFVFGLCRSDDIWICTSSSGSRWHVIFG